MQHMIYLLNVLDIGFIYTRMSAWNHNGASVCCRTFMGRHASTRQRGSKLKGTHEGLGACRQHLEQNQRSLSSFSACGSPDVWPLGPAGSLAGVRTHAISEQRRSVSPQSVRTQIPPGKISTHAEIFQRKNHRGGKMSNGKTLRGK